MIKKIKAKPLTKEAFEPYGSVIYIPTDGDPDRPTDRFNFWPKLCLYECESGTFQIGVSTFFKRPFRSVNFERHYKSQEFMTPLNGSIIILFAKNKGLDPNEELDYDDCEAFIITQEQGVVVNAGVWHWTPFPLVDQTSIICSFQEDTQINDLDIRTIRKGEVIEIEV